VPVTVAQVPLLGVAQSCARNSVRRTDGTGTRERTRSALLSFCSSSPLGMITFPFRCHSLSFKNLRRSHLIFGIGEIRFEVG
jgi:hypothetical protein